MIKRTLSVILALFLLFSFVSCGKDENNPTETKDTKIQDYKSLITDMFDALVAGDYSKASTYFYTGSNSTFEEYCKKAETDNNFKFSGGYEIVRYTSEYCVDSEKPVKGVAYVYDLHVNFGETKCFALIQIIDDGEKIGLINFEVGSRTAVE